MKVWLDSPYLWKNPIVVKDVRTRMRGMRTYLLVTAHLLALALVVAAAYFVFRSSLTTTGNLEQRRIFGKAVFGLLVWMELVMVSFVAPAMTSGAISAERERQSYDLLKVTLLSTRQLVLGKFFPGLAFVFLLLFTSIPLQGPSFLIGGVLWEEIVLSTLILLVTAAAFSALGLLLSALVRRTMIATAIAYATTIFLVFGVPIIFVILLLLLNTAMSNTQGNSMQAGERILLLVGWLLAAFTPTGVMIGSEISLLDQHNLFSMRIPLSGGLEIWLPAPWIPYVVIYLLFCASALWLSMQIVKKPDV